MIPKTWETNWLTCHDKMGKPKADTFKEQHQIAEFGIWDRSCAIKNDGGPETSESGKTDGDSLGWDFLILVFPICFVSVLFWAHSSILG